MTHPTPTRTELPAAGTWTIDEGHADVGFIGRHFMLTRIRGRFTGIKGTIEIGEDPVESKVAVTVDMDSVDTGDATRDEHLRSLDLFDVDRHPTARFESNRVVWNGDAGFVHGDLTIKGVTHPVTLATRMIGEVSDPWDARRAVFAATATINREDWGVSWNMALDTGGLLVSKEIDLVIEFEAVKSEA